MDNPFDMAQRGIEQGGDIHKRTSNSGPSVSTPSVPSAVVAYKKIEDDDSRYMEDAQNRINQRLNDSGARSSSYRTRRFVDRRFGRRSGR